MENIDSKQLCVGLLQSLTNSMLKAHRIPQGDDLALIRVTSAEARAKGKDLSNKILASIRAVASRYAVAAKSTDSESHSSDSTTSVSPRDAIYDETMETIEEALEHFNTALDSVRGIKDAVVAPTGALAPSDIALKIGHGNTSRRHGGFLDIEKPQIRFPDYPIDNSDTPFVAPYIGQSVVKEEHGRQGTSSKGEQLDCYLQDLFMKNSQTTAESKHPYEEEIAIAAAEMSKRKFREEDTQVDLKLEQTPCTMVESEEELFNVAQRLKGVTEIAVDLENHSVRSFQGFTCLMQISTRREDFVVDVLKLRGHIHRALASIFADESIVKVLHGADKDVQWLERDFGIYVVNMFDTGQAARLLKLPSASLSYLQLRYCNIKGNNKKKFQLSDWRQRPLPDDMYAYARSDTHHLLYIYDRVRSELTEKELLARAWDRSAVISQKRHKKIRYNSGLAKYLASRHALRFDQQQMRLLEELLRWRDVMAREEDESLVFVAPTNTIFGIVRARDKARTVPGLLQFGFPGRVIPSLMHEHAEELTRLISDALDAKLEKVLVEKKENPEEWKDNKAVISHFDPQGNEDDTGSMGSGEDETGDSKLVRKAAGKDTEEDTLVLPDQPAKIAKRPKSSLFASDSESSSDEEEASGTTNERTLVAHESAVHKTEAHATKSEPHTSNVMEKGRSPKSRHVPDAFSLETNEVKGNQVPKVKAAKGGMFDLSDSSDDDGSAIEDTERHCKQQGKEALARVLAQFAAEQASALTVENFRVETDAVDAVEEENAEELIDAKVEEEHGAKEDASDDDEKMSILGTRKRQGDGRAARKRRRKEKKGKRKAVEDKADPLEAFDYAKALAEDKKASRSLKITDSTGFDPMQKLRADWKGANNRGKVRRRKPGRAKSMSFKAKKK